MNAAKKGLGRGLSALFGDIENKSNPNEIQKNKLPISDLQRNQYQPRTIFDEDKLAELTSSIKENGVVQPIAVRPNKYEPGKFEIIAGERRWLAAQKAGLNEVPVLILDINDQKSLEIAIVENVQRQDLNVIEEAKGYMRLIKEFGYDHEKVAKFMSKSRSHVSNTLRLLTLPEDIIGLIEEGKLTAGQARPLIGMANASEVAENIVKKRVAAREVESIAKSSKKSTQKIKDPNVEFVRNEIESKLGLNVEINNKKNNSGKIIIKYESLEQFELISKLLRK
ncbi:MAG: chromosome partitioning protein ParB [Candidatus Pelagibacter sp.]|nr:chromosome partitioning protein ParB [Candidatus Pelagibacter sp.]|tara:strand:+ start:13304 stop:14146 length:843 start_codon:yes stop_codon:yes gene_type:complete